MEHKRLSQNSTAPDNRLAMSARDHSIVSSDIAHSATNNLSHHVAINVHDPSIGTQNSSDGSMCVPDLPGVSPTPTFNSESEAKGRLGVILDASCALVTLAITVLSIIASLGTPYWYYRCYRLQRPSGILSRTEQEKSELDLESLCTEKWNKVLGRLKSQWKAFFAISAGALPAVFPMLAIYPDPKCSWASLLAALALFSGIMSMCMAKLFLYFSELFEEEAMVKDWCMTLQASRSIWRHYSTQKFWVFLSLPALWVSSQITTLSVTVILAVWEQVTVFPPGGVCDQSRLQLFRILSLFSLSMAVVQLAFFAFVVNSLIVRT